MNLFVFDIDGTLLDSTDVDAECYEQAMKNVLGISFIEFDWEKYKDVTDQGVTEDILSEHFGRTATKEEIGLIETEMGKLVGKERQLNPQKFIPAKGINALLNELQNQNEIAFCLATGAWRTSAEEKLSAVEALKLDQTIWCHAGPLRRRADIVTSSINQVKTQMQINEFDHICALGDGAWDFHTANELDLNFIGVDLKKTGRLKEIGAEKVISEYSNLSELFNLAF